MSGEMKELVPELAERVKALSSAEKLVLASELLNAVPPRRSLALSIIEYVRIDLLADQIVAGELR